MKEKKFTTIKVSKKVLELLRELRYLEGNKPMYRILEEALCERLLAVRQTPSVQEDKTDKTKAFEDKFSELFNVTFVENKK